MEMKVRRKKDVPFRRKLAFGLLAVALALVSCQGAISTAQTPDLISTPYSFDMPLNGPVQFISSEINFGEQAPDGTVRVSTLGNPFTINFAVDGRIINISPPTSQIENPCEASQDFTRQSQEKALPYSIEDLRASVCKRYESLAKKMEMDDDQAKVFKEYMAKNTYILQDVDIQQICGGAEFGACEENGSIFISVASMSALPHETEHFWESKIPDGAYYLSDNNICIIKKYGLISFIYVDSSTGLNSSAVLTNELLAVLEEINTSPLKTSAYSPDPNSSLTGQLRQLAANHPDILKRLIPPDLNSSASLNNLAGILEDIIDNEGLQLLLSADLELQLNIQQLFGMSINNTRSESILNPIEACQ